MCIFVGEAKRRTNDSKKIAINDGFLPVVVGDDDDDVILRQIVSAFFFGQHSLKGQGKSTEQFMFTLAWEHIDTLVISNGLDG